MTLYYRSLTIHRSIFVMGTIRLLESPLFLDLRTSEWYTFSHLTKGTVQVTSVCPRKTNSPWGRDVPSKFSSSGQCLLRISERKVSPVDGREAEPDQPQTDSMTWSF